MPRPFSVKSKETHGMAPTFCKLAESKTAKLAPDADRLRSLVLRHLKNALCPHVCVNSRSHAVHMQRVERRHVAQWFSAGYKVTLDGSFLGLLSAFPAATSLCSCLATWIQRSMGNK